MKLHVMSDLHVEFGGYEPPETDADVVILAGDIHVKQRGVEWAKSRFGSKPVLYVLGNHEYYGEALPRNAEKLKEMARGSNIHVLENDVVTIGDWRFLGCTLWTDFKLHGDPRIAGHAATQKMTDFKKIRMSPEYRKMRSLDAAIVHARSIDWLKRELQGKNAKTVVITHHAPSESSLPEKYRADILSAAYASRLDEVVKTSQAKLWVHGHIHSSSDYWVGDTRVICNPRGYTDELNPDFLPGLVVEA